MLIGDRVAFAIDQRIIAQGAIEIEDGGVLVAIVEVSAVDLVSEDLMAQVNVAETEFLY